MNPEIRLETAREEFLEDVRAGLSRMPKRLPCRWFYDAEGSRLFEAIMELPEYYLTPCETRILSLHREGILKAFQRHGAGEGAADSWWMDAGTDRFHVVDLGAGNGAKTRILLDHFLRKETLASYHPVDVSVQALASLAESLRARLAGLPLRPMEADWMEALDALETRLPGRKLVLFLGSNIGNQGAREAIAFLTALRARLRPGDGLLIGFDLRKDPERILRAYSDSAGVTARFNLNLLHRINRELGGKFRVEDFRHVATYDPAQGEARSHLVAVRALEVPIAAAGMVVRFFKDEPIHTESSRKYSLWEAEAMARAAGFVVAAHFGEPSQSFLDSLWVPGHL